MIILDSAAERTVTRILPSVPMAWLEGSDLAITRPTTCVGSKATAVPSTPKTTPKKRKRRVRFKDLSEYESYERQGVSVLTWEERTAVWYTKKEIIGFRTNSRKLVKEQKLTQDSEDFSIRGLEDAVSLRACAERKNRRGCVLRDVLKEQDRQRQKKCFDVEKLRKKSRSTSRESVKVAFRFAQQDYEAIRGEHDKPFWASVQESSFESVLIKTHSLSRSSSFSSRTLSISQTPRSSNDASHTVTNAITSSPRRTVGRSSSYSAAQTMLRARSSASTSPSSISTKSQHRQSLQPISSGSESSTTTTIGLSRSQHRESLTNGLSKSQHHQSLNQNESSGESSLTGKLKATRFNATLMHDGKNRRTSRPGSKSSVLVPFLMEDHHPFALSSPEKQNHKHKLLYSSSSSPKRSIPKTLSPQDSPNSPKVVVPLKKRPSKILNVTAVPAVRL